MKKNINNINSVIAAIVMAMSLAACGGAESASNASADAGVVSNEEIGAEEEYADESSDSDDRSEETGAGESEEDAETEEVIEETAEEEVSDETPDFKVMYFIEWGSGRGLHSSFKVETDDVWSSNVDFWADYEVADGQCNINEKIGGLYYEAPIDFTRLVTGDKEDTYIMVCDQDKKFVVVYIVDEANMGNYTPWEGYDSVVNGHFAVWYTPDVDAQTAQRILDSCEVLQGEELNERFSELQGRYVPES